MSAPGTCQQALYRGVRRQQREGSHICGGKWAIFQIVVRDNMILCDDDRGYLRHPAGGRLRDAPLLGVAAAGPRRLQDAFGLLDQALLVRRGDS